MYFFSFTVFRLLVPFVLGILLGNYLYFEGVECPAGILLISVLFLPFLLGFSYQRFSKYTSRWVFGCIVYTSFLLMGAGWQQVRLQRVAVDFPSTETVYRVMITGEPEQKERSVSCEARVMEQRDLQSVKNMNTPTVLLYFASDSAAATIERGSELLLSTRLSPPALSGNPDEFDYPRFLIYKGISATGFVSTGKWRVVSRQSTISSLQDFAYDCRDKLLQLYRDLGFEGDNFAVLSALTVGYKEELSESVRESFSISGVSHVLALSGLHIGFLYVLLFFLLNQIPGTSISLRIFRVTVIVVLLWAFAMLTGFSPSVVRSVIMFSLVGLSTFSTRRSFSFNTLFVAAMGMLIYNPSWLYDVGFQLSFVAVASILFIQPWLYAKLEVRNRLLDKLWALATVSIAAQMGVAPLVMFYFSRFSVHFLITNILVVPLVTIIIYIAIVMLLFSFLPLVSGVVAVGLNLLLELLNGIVRGVERMPLASIDGIKIYPVEILLLYMLLFLLGGYIVQRRPRFLLAFLSLFLVLTVHRFYQVQEDAPQQSVVFYHVRQCPAVHCILPNGRSWISYADSVPDDTRLRRVVSNYWNRLRLEEPVSVVADYQDEAIIRNNNIILFGDKKICMVNDNRWYDKNTSVRLAIDYLYICRGYTGDMKQLSRLFEISQVVLDASLPDYRRNILQAECQLLGIKAYLCPQFYRL